MLVGGIRLDEWRVDQARDSESGTATVATRGVCGGRGGCESRLQQDKMGV